MLKLNENTKTILVDLISTVFILLFVYAATSKLLDFQKFSIELAKSPILNFISGYVAIVVPISEIIISILLIIKRFQIFALYACVSIMVMFCGYVVLILKFSLYIPCTCGGILQSMNWTQHLIFNFCFLILGVIGLVLYPVNKRPYLQ